jgi:MFS family permease
MLGAALLGLAAGAEVDVVTFVAARRFDQRIFGALYAIIIAAFGGAASMGPLIAGALVDRYGTYGMFLVTAAGLSAAGAVLMSMVATGARAVRTPDAQAPIPLSAKG